MMIGYGLTYNNIISTMVRRQSTINEWKSPCDRTFEALSPKDSTKTIWDLSRAFMKRDDVRVKMSGLLREADNYGLPGSTFTTRSHNAECKNLFSSWRDEIGLFYPTEQMSQTFEVPKNCLGTVSSMLSDMKALRNAGISNQSTARFGIIEDHYESLNELIDTYKDTKTTPDWFRPDLTTKKSGNKRLVIRDMIASWIRVKVRKEKVAPESLKKKLETDLKDVIDKKVIEDGYNDATTEVTAYEQEANIDRAFIMAWCFQDFTLEKFKDTTDRIDKLITRPAEKGAEWVSGFKNRIGGDIQKALTWVKPMAKGEMNGHKHQSPVLISSKRWMDALSLRCALNTRMTALQAYASSDNPIGMICAQNAVDKMTSDDAVSRTSYWLLHRTLFSRTVAMEWTGKIKGNALSATPIEVDAKSIVVSANCKSFMRSISSFASRTDKQVLDSIDQGDFVSKRRPTTLVA